MNEQDRPMRGAGLLLEDFPFVFCFVCVTVFAAYFPFLPSFLSVSFLLPPVYLCFPLPF